MNIILLTVCFAIAYILIGLLMRAILEKGGNVLNKTESCILIFLWPIIVVGAFVYGIFGKGGT